MFLSGPNSTGGFAWSATPDPLGPRNRGHASESSALNPSVLDNPAASNAMSKFIRISCFLSRVWFNSFVLPGNGRLGSRDRARPQVIATSEFPRDHLCRPHGSQIGTTHRGCWRYGAWPPTGAIRVQGVSVAGLQGDGALRAFEGCFPRFQPP